MILHPYRSRRDRAIGLSEASQANLVGFDLAYFHLVAQRITKKDLVTDSTKVPEAIRPIDQNILKLNRMWKKLLLPVVPADVDTNHWTDAGTTGIKISLYEYWHDS